MFWGFFRCIAKRLTVAQFALCSLLSRQTGPMTVRTYALQPKAQYLCRRWYAESGKRMGCYGQLAILFRCQYDDECGGQSLLNVSKTGLFLVLQCLLDWLEFSVVHFMGLHDHFVIEALCAEVRWSCLPSAWWVACWNILKVRLLGLDCYQLRFFVRGRCLTIINWRWCGCQCDIRRSGTTRLATQTLVSIRDSRTSFSWTLQDLRDVCPFCMVPHVFSELFKQWKGVFPLFLLKL